MVTILKSIEVLIYIAVYLNYEICHMDVKTTFLNDYLDESIYMIQPDVFIAKGREHLVCKLHKSIFGLIQASCSWNKCLEHAIKTFDFGQNKNEPYVYRRVQGSMTILS